MAERRAAAPRSPRRPHGAPMHIRAVMGSCAVGLGHLFTDPTVCYGYPDIVAPILATKRALRSSGVFHNMCAYCLVSKCTLSISSSDKSKLL